MIPEQAKPLHGKRAAPSLLSRRSIIFRLGLCVLLGFETTWLVAAAFAVWADKRPHRFVETVWPPLDSESDGPFILRIRLLGIGFEGRSVSLLQIDPLSGAQGRTQTRPGLAKSDPDPPPEGSWGRWRDRSDEQLMTDYASCMEEGFGWPRLSFWYPVVSPSGSDEYSGRGGVDLFPLTGLSQHQRRALPLRPIWPGVLIDTGFYAGLWAMLFVGVSLLRMHRRRRRGQCPRCSYDLRHGLEHGCPECGWSRSGGD